METVIPILVFLTIMWIDLKREIKKNKNAIHAVNSNKVKELDI